MMSNQGCDESKRQDFPELIGAKVVSIEVSGGSKYGKDIMIVFDGGKTLRVEAELFASINGIYPQLMYMVGGWFAGEPEGGSDGNQRR
jgi:hypothetical protein